MSLRLSPDNMPCRSLAFTERYTCDMCKQWHYVRIKWYRDSKGEIIKDYYLDDRPYPY